MPTVEPYPYPTHVWPDAGSSAAPHTTPRRTFQEYIPEQQVVLKDDIHLAIHALETGLEHARENLSRHDTELGRTTRKNETWAKQIEQDIESIEQAIARLKSYGPAVNLC